MTTFSWISESTSELANATTAAPGIEQFEYVIAQKEALELVVIDVLYYVTLVMGIFAIIGNVIVIASLLVNVRTIKPFMIFIMSLAVSDFLQGCSAIFKFLHVQLAVIPWSMWGCWGTYAVQLAATLASTFSVLVLSIDTYVSIIKPMHHERLMRRRVAIALVIPPWLFSLAVAIGTAVLWATPGPHIWHPEELVREVYAYMPCIYAGYFRDVRIDMAVTVFSLVPIIVTVLLYVHAYLRITQRRKLQADTETRTRSYRKTAVTIIVIVALYVVAYMPLNVYGIVATTQLVTTPQQDTICVVIGFMLGVTNSVLDPLVYAVRIPSMRTRMVALLHGGKFTRRHTGSAIATSTRTTGASGSYMSTSDVSISVKSTSVGRTPQDSPTKALSSFVNDTHERTLADQWAEASAPHGFCETSERVGAVPASATTEKGDKGSAESPPTCGRQNQDGDGNSINASHVTKM